MEEDGLFVLPGITGFSESFGLILSVYADSTGYVCLCLCTYRRLFRVKYSESEKHMRGIILQELEHF